MRQALVVASMRRRYPWHPPGGKAAAASAPAPPPLPPTPPPAWESVQTDPLTLSAWILTQQHKSVGARGRLTVLLNAIGTGCKYVSSAVRRVGPGVPPPAPVSPLVRLSGCLCACMTAPSDCAHPRRRLDSSHNAAPPPP